MSVVADPALRVLWWRDLPGRDLEQLDGLRDLPPGPVLLLSEKPFVGPGASSAVTIASTWGWQLAWMAREIAGEVDIVTLPASTWQATLGLTGRPRRAERKAAAQSLASEIMGPAALRGLRGSTVEAVSDAVCMAAWWRSVGGPCP